MGRRWILIMYSEEGGQLRMRERWSTACWRRRGCTDKEGVSNIIRWIVSKL